MNISLLLEMAAEGAGSRVAIGSRADGVTYQELLARARRAAAWLGERAGTHLVLCDVNSLAAPIALYGASLGGKTYVPLNYRLSTAALRSIVDRIDPAVAIVDDEVDVNRDERFRAGRALSRHAFLDLSEAAMAAINAEVGTDDVAVLLFTSGTTAAPKAAILRHRHLVEYVLSTVDFMAADDDECLLVSVPPYHIAGVSALLTSVYIGRRIIQLPQFTPEAWVRTVELEGVTHAMVVPTMLERILRLDNIDRRLASLRHLAYGGGRMPVEVIERALELLPQVDFVNAYGLTETSSTVALLGPDDHRAAFSSPNPEVRRRLASVGLPVPGVEISVRDETGTEVAPTTPGEVWVRGGQVAGEYVEGPVIGANGWFPTRDRGYLDASGFLYLEGRLDDVIVRGGENIAPQEVEDVLRSHPGVVDAAVVGTPDREWGEVVTAVVVRDTRADLNEEDLKKWVRDRLRSTRVPAHIRFTSSLPYSDVGKLLRRVVREQVSIPGGAST